MGSQWRLGSLRLCSNSGPTSRLSKNSMRTWSMPLELWSRRLPALSTNELPLLLGMSDRPAGDGLLALMASANWRISRVRKSTRWGWSWIILLWPRRPWLDFWLASAGCRAKHPNYFDSALLDSSQWVSAGIGEWRGLLCFLALCWDNVEKYCHLYFCWCLQPWQGQSATAWVVHGILAVASSGRSNLMMGRRLASTQRRRLPFTSKILVTWSWLKTRSPHSWKRWMPVPRLLAKMRSPTIASRKNLVKMALSWSRTKPFLPFLHWNVVELYVHLGF